MSNYTAIGGVSRTLRTLLHDRMVGPPDNVTIAPPDVTIDGLSGSRINLYLFQVSENGSLKNQEIPGHGHPGAFGCPPLCLDLHYMLTAYGSSETGADSDLQAQQILGDAMRTMHDFSIVTEGLQITNPAAGTVGDSILDSSLRGEFEQLKITLRPLTLDDFSKLWTALPGANFRRSVAYHVSVIQIESRLTRRYPQLVGEPLPAGPRVHVLPFKSPQIYEIRVIRQNDPDMKEKPYPYARIGDTLILRGQNFIGDSIHVFLGEEEAPIADLKNNRIEVNVPDNVALQPGPQTVKVVVKVMMGDPLEAHMGFYSNLAVFMLVPRIDLLTEDLVSIPRTLQVNGTRLFNEHTECITLIGDRVIPSGDYTTATSSQISFNLPDNLGSGDYPVRVRVNGTENIIREILTIP